MPEIKELTKKMQELEEQLVSCMKCGMCQSVCPLFEQTRKEADVARGKLVLLESLMNEMFDNPQGVSKRLNKCLLCGSCAANCPSGVNVVEIFIKARSIITGYLQLSFIKKIVFRKMLAQPAVFDWIINMSSKFQNFFLTDPDPDTQTTSIKLLSPLLKDRRIMPVAESSFQTSLKTGPAGKFIGGKSPTGSKVAFFTGCLIDKIFVQVGIATIKSLIHHNFKVFIPEKQGCCGIPALAAGDSDTFFKLVKHNIESFNGEHFDYLVTSCATCTSTIKKLWPSMVQDKDGSLHDKAADLAEKTFDISQFLIATGDLKSQEPESRRSQKNVTYHDPCHLLKSLGIGKEPRQLIQAASGYTLKEMKGADKCCGMGGSFNLYHYDISSKIGNIKKENIQATGCKIVATSCPACMMQISDMLSKEMGGIKVKHPIELYCEGIK